MSYDVRILLENKGITRSRNRYLRNIFIIIVYSQESIVNHSIRNRNPNLHFWWEKFNFARWDSRIVPAKAGDTVWYSCYPSLISISEKAWGTGCFGNGKLFLKLSGTKLRVIIMYLVVSPYEILCFQSDLFNNTMPMMDWFTFHI